MSSTIATAIAKAVVENPFGCHRNRALFCWLFGNGEPWATVLAVIAELAHMDVPLPQLAAATDAIQRELDRTRLRALCVNDMLYAICGRRIVQVD
jgi:hypothetical protein